MDMKYIDADTLIAEIDDRLHCNGAFDEVGDYAWHYDQGMVDAYNHIKDFITSLRHEQPEMDLEKEAVSFCFDNGINISPRQAKSIARHFYNLALEDVRKWAEMQNCNKKQIQPIIDFIDQLSK